MLKLTKKIEYALIALRHMQTKGCDNISSAKEISETYEIPYEILAKTLQHLARNSIIKAIQGPKGGYLLERVPAGIQMIQFIEMMEGPIGLVDCQISGDCLRLDTCNIRLPIEKLNQDIQKVLREVTLADILVS